MLHHDGREDTGGMGIANGLTPGGDDDATGVGPSQLLSALLENRRVIAIVALLFSAAVVAFTLGSSMEFKTSGRMYLGELENKQKSGGSHDTEFAATDASDLSSEIEILRSAELVDRAILKSGLNVAVAPTGWKPPSYLRWRLSGRDHQILDHGLQEITVVDVSVRDQFDHLRKYSVRFVSPDKYEVWAEGTRRLGRGTLGVPTHVGDVDMTVLPGSLRRPVIGAQYDLEVRPLELVRKDVLRELKIEYPRAISQNDVPRVLFIEFPDGSPLLATRFLRALLTGYLEERRSWKTEDASAAEEFVTNQLRSIRESLDQTEQRLTDYRTHHASVALNTEAEAMIGQIGRYEEQRVASRLELATLSDLRRALKDPNARIETYLASGVTDSVLDGLTRSLAESRQALALAEQRANGNQSASDVRMHRAAVDAQLSTIKNYVETRYARAQQNLGSMNHVINQYEEKLRTVPGAELGLAQLARESEVYSKLYSYLLERQQQAAISKASSVSKNRILDLPQIPSRESSPSLIARAGVCLFGLVLGIAFVILRMVFSPTLQSEHDLYRLAGRVPFFASIPRRSAVAQKQGRPGFDLLSEEPSSPFAEAFRMLRANLYQVPSSGEGKVVLVTSPTPGDGKSTTAISLSVMLAADGKTVLLLDADVRKPSHHKILRQALEPGLSAVLLRECDWMTATRAIETEYGDFYALTAGRPAAAELLSHEGMGTFLAQAKKRFDYIIVDSASFPLVSDALVLAPHADCVLSVLRLLHTPKKLALRHLRRMSMVHSQYGLILNGGQPNEGYGYVSEKMHKRPATETAAGTETRSPSSRSAV